MTSSNGNIPGEFPTQRPVTRSFDVYFDLRPNKRWVNNREAGELRHHLAHYDVIVMGRMDHQWKFGVANCMGEYIHVFIDWNCSQKPELDQYGWIYLEIIVFHNFVIITL